MKKSVSNYGGFDRPAARTYQIRPKLMRKFPRLTLSHMSNYGPVEAIVNKHLDSHLQKESFSHPQLTS